MSVYDCLPETESSTYHSHRSIKVRSVTILCKVDLRYMPYFLLLLLLLLLSLNLFLLMKHYFQCVCMCGFDRLLLNVSGSSSVGASRY